MKTNILILLLLSFFSIANADHIDDRSNKFIIVYNEDWAPYSYKDNKGNTKGILPQMFTELLNNKLKIEIKNLSFPAKRAHHFVEDGTYDAFVLNHKTEEHHKKLLVSKNYLLKLQLMTFLNKNTTNYSENINIINPMDKKGLAFCKLLSDEASDDVLEQKKINSHKAINMESAIGMLADGRTDFFIGEKMSTLSYLYSKSKQEDIVMHPFVVNEFLLKFMVNKKNKKNIEIFKKLELLITKMKQDGSYFKLIEKIEDRVLKDILIQSKLY